MPVVPFSPGPATTGQPQLPPMPDEKFQFMAAAQMHDEGRLFVNQTDPKASPPPKQKRR